MNIYLLGDIAFERLKDQITDIIERNEPLNVIIGSYGGNGTTALGLYDILNNRCNTYCLGTAQSAGGIIFLSGKQRFITKHSTVLFHRCWYTRLNDVNAYDINSINSDRKIVDNSMLDIIKSKTDIKEWSEDSDMQFTSQEAIKHNIATGIWEDKQD